MYYQEVKGIFKDASMNMCKWASNDKNIMQQVKAEDKCPDKVLKVLGMIWNTDTDKLNLVSVIGNVLGGTICKRNMLQIIASGYDPLGLMTPALK